MKDKNGLIIKPGNVIKYKGRFFDVVKYSGTFGKKGRLKLMERKSMLEGAIDGWLDELKGEEKNILIMPKEQER